MLRAHIQLFGELLVLLSLVLSGAGVCPARALAVTLPDGSDACAGAQAALDVDAEPPAEDAPVPVSSDPFRGEDDDEDDQDDDFDEDAQASCASHTAQHPGMTPPAPRPVALRAVPLSGHHSLDPRPPRLG